MRFTALYAAVFLAASCLVVAATTLPIVIMHGVLSSAQDMSDLKALILTKIPKAEIYLMDIFDGISSFKPVWEQVALYKTQLASFNVTGPYNVITHSQGGIVVRGVIESDPNHNVQTWVALSSPFMGQFGDTDYLRFFFPNLLARDAYHVMYSKAGQNDVSLANYWKDPAHLDLYLEMSAFLAFVNNEVSHNQEQMYKDNFTKLKLLVSIGGPDDGVIMPYWSALWGYWLYDPNTGKHLSQTMTQTDLYASDAFGLRTLDERGAVKLFNISGVHHTSWHSNTNVVYNYVVPYLM